jgi:hypothetical protein
VESVNILLAFLIAALVIGAFIVVAFRAQRRGVARLLESHRSLNLFGLQRELQMLLKRGYDGGFVVFSDENTDWFVQFRKYIRDSQAVGLEMHFPRSSWAEPFYQNIKEVLERNEVRFNIITRDVPMEFIYADFAQDVTQAARAAWETFVVAFNIQEPRIRAEAAGLSPFDEWVTTRGRPSLWQTARRVLKSSP